jgi:hypothetical protein
LSRETVVPPLDPLTFIPSPLHHLAPHAPTRLRGCRTSLVPLFGLIVFLGIPYCDQWRLTGYGYSLLHAMSTLKASNHLTLGLHPHLVLMMEVPHSLCVHRLVVGSEDNILLRWDTADLIRVCLTLVEVLHVNSIRSIEHP